MGLLDTPTLTTLSDWAYYGAKQPLATITQNDSPGSPRDSLFRRIKENRLTDADKRHLEREAAGHEKPATYDDLLRLQAAVKRRYQAEPRSQADRLATAWSIVDDIGPAAWSMRIGNVADRLDDLEQRINCR